MKPDSFIYLTRGCPVSSGCEIIRNFGVREPVKGKGTGQTDEKGCLMAVTTLNVPYKL